MTTFVTSKGTRAQHVFPKYQSRSYRPHPSRREFIHGPIRPMNDNLVTMGKRINSTRIALGIGLFAVAVFGGEELRAIAYGTVAGRQSPSRVSPSRPVGRPSTIARSE